MKKIKIVMLLLFVIVSVGVTYAYYTSSDTIPNEFFVGDFYVIIEEEFEEGSSFNRNTHEISKKVYVSNKEDTPAIVRVSYNEYMTFDDYAGDPYLYVVNNYDQSGERIVKNWAEGFYDDWIYYNGWYYYMYVLPANTSVQILESITARQEVYNEDNYNLDFNLEAVQATPDAVKELWGIDVTIEEDGFILWGIDR